MAERMRMALPYDGEGNINEHFGHAKQFKIYDLQMGGALTTMIIDSEGEGHDAQVELLKKGDVKVLICNHIGQAAIDGLNAAGILPVPGIAGATDDAVRGFLQGILEEISGPTCGGGCGGCHGGCGSEMDDDCGCGGGCGGCH